MIFAQVLVQARDAWLSLEAFGWAKTIGGLRKLKASGATQVGLSVHADLRCLQLGAIAQPGSRLVTTLLVESYACAAVAGRKNRETGLSRPVKGRLFLQLLTPPLTNTQIRGFFHGLLTQRQAQPCRSPARLPARPEQEDVLYETLGA